MSTPNDPPLSRRAARQSDVTAQDAQTEAAQPLTRRARAAAAASAPPSAPTSAPPSAPGSYAPPATFSPPASFSAPGDVDYRTEVRPRVPHYDAPPAGHAVGAPTGAPLAPPLVEPPVAPSAMPSTERVRRRDFRPPTEQAAPSETAAAPAPQVSPAPVAPPVQRFAPGQAVPPGQQFAPAPPAQPLPTAPMGAPGTDVPLSYHTQASPGMAQPAPPPPGLAYAATPQAPSGNAPSGPAPSVQPMPAAYDAPGEQTLSRRELRELRDRTGLPAESAEGLGGSVSAPGTEAWADTAARAAAFLAPAAAPAAAPSMPPAPTSMPPAPPSMPQAASPAAPAVESTASASPSTGSHWSVGIHDDDDPFENTFSREVGSAVSLSNTNALVLPEMPTGGISGPVAGTGEIIITGMIDVPRVVSSTGAVPAVHENPDIDDLFDPGDLTAGPADAAPVSALKAVSSHTASHTVITTGTRRSSNAITTVLVASTVVMAVVAIGLFVLAAINGLF